MPVSFSADDDVDRLPGTTASGGGLVVRKRNPDMSANGEQASRLGLDRLAEIKREERRHEAERQYRQRPPDTPSTGIDDLVRSNIER